MSLTVCDNGHDAISFDAVAGHSNFYGCPACIAINNTEKKEIENSDLKDELEEKNNRILELEEEIKSAQNQPTTTAMPGQEAPKPCLGCKFMDCTLVQKPREDGTCLTRTPATASA